MRRSRFLTSAGYGLAVLLIVLPALEPVVTLLPPQPGQIAWRLQVFGVLSQSLLLPLAGGVVAVVTAFLLGHRKAMRGLAAGAFLGTLLLIAAAVLFVLDLVQYQGAVPDGLTDYYRAAGVLYLSAFLLAAGFLAWIGAGAWRVSRSHRRRSGRRHHAPEAAPASTGEATAAKPPLHQ
ncbi:MAG TPA: hypothetical protein VK929_04585 [Longimicrobiales bacterium]|nr:hypothetical protein [Longimicrobiales bacterium]